MKNNRFYRVHKSVYAAQIIGESILKHGDMLQKNDMLFLLQIKLQKWSVFKSPWDKSICIFDLVFMDPKNLSRWFLKEFTLHEFDIYFKEINLSRNK